MTDEQRKKMREERFKTSTSEQELDKDHGRLKQDSDEERIGIKSRIK